MEKDRTDATQPPSEEEDKAGEDAWRALIERLSNRAAAEVHADRWTRDELYDD